MLDDQTHLAQNTTMARLFRIILIIAAVLLAFIVLSMLALAIMLMIPSGFREQFLAQFRADGDVMARSASSLALTYFGTAIVAAAYFWVVMTLRKIVKTLLAGDPFVPDNISRLRSIWIIIACAEVVNMIVRYFAFADDSTGDIELFVSPETWFLVFVIAALAEVFRHGAELRRDAELTV